eukprot:1241258-Lingulodinium_polyedra.AAC.1
MPEPQMVHEVFLALEPRPALHSMLCEVTGKVPLSLSLWHPLQLRLQQGRNANGHLPPPRFCHVHCHKVHDLLTLLAKLTQVVCHPQHRPRLIQLFADLPQVLLHPPGPR